MFQNRQLTGRRSGWGGWLLLLLFGGGLLLLYVQTGFLPDSTVSATPTALSTLATGVTPEPTSETGYLLAEYDTSVPSFLDTGLEAEAIDEPPLWQSAGEFALKLGLVIGLLYAALAGLRWLQGSGRRAAGPGGATIRILETTGLAPGRSLHLVVVGEKTLLIGATEHQLSLLAEVSEASLPLPDEELVSPDFETALAASQPAAQATSEWQMTMNHLRSGLHHLRESVRR